MQMQDKTQVMGQNPVQPAGVQPTVAATRTQMGVGATQLGVGRTQMGADPMRTAMGMPMQTVEVECLPGNRYAMAPETSREHALVVIKASGQQLGRRAPINVCLCIDRSGSMEGEPLEYVK